MKRNIREIKKTHRIFVEIEDKDRKRTIDAYGHEVIPVKWIEVPEINLGSLKNPNKLIFGLKIEPIEEERKPLDLGDIFRGFSGGDD